MGKRSEIWVCTNLSLQHSTALAQKPTAPSLGKGWSQVSAHTVRYETRTFLLISFLTAFITAYEPLEIQKNTGKCQWVVSQSHLKNTSYGKQPFFLLRIICAVTHKGHRQADISERGSCVLLGASYVTPFDWSKCLLGSQMFGHSPWQCWVT